MAATNPFQPAAADILTLGLVEPPQLQIAEEIAPRVLELSLSLIGRFTPIRGTIAGILNLERGRDH